MKLSVLLSLSLVSLLAACASPLEVAEKEAERNRLNTPVKVNVSVPFNEAQAKAAMAYGNIAIKGVLYHKLEFRGRNVSDGPLTMRSAVFLDGVTVLLYPLTDHLLELNKLEEENNNAYKKSAKNRFHGLLEGVQLKHFIPDPLMYKYAIKTKTDKYGKYSFEKLKPGKYFIVAMDQDISSSGYEDVRSGSSYITNGYYGANATHYTTREFTVRSAVRYSETVELKSDQKQVILESRMRLIN